MAKGSVRKKGKKWYYRFYVEDASGNMVQKECAGTESKSETEKLLRQAMEDYESKKFIAKADNITLGQLLDTWAEEELKTGTLSNDTVSTYLQAINRIKQHPVSRRKLKTLRGIYSSLWICSHSVERLRTLFQRDIPLTIYGLIPQYCNSPSALRCSQNSTSRSIPCSMW